MESVLWFLIWLAIGCLIVFLGFKLLPRIFSGESLRIANIIWGVIAFLALIAYCYYYFPPIGVHDLPKRR